MLVKGDTVVFVQNFQTSLRYVTAGSHRVFCVVKYTYYLYHAFAMTKIKFRMQA